MVVGIILSILGQFGIGVFKAVSDITDHEDNWRKSVFSKNSIESFFGSKDHTWKRKQGRSNLLVGLSDIWHLSNTLRTVCNGLFCTGCVLIAISLVGIPQIIFVCSIPVLVFSNRVPFHLFYTYILRV